MFIEIADINSQMAINAVFVSVLPTVLRQLNTSIAISTMTSGQCRLAPLIQVIQDCSHLYHYSVKLLFKLHACEYPLLLLLFSSSSSSSSSYSYSSYSSSPPVGVTDSQSPAYGTNAATMKHICLSPNPTGMFILLL